jgi:hypothetical protein
MHPLLSPATSGLQPPAGEDPQHGSDQPKRLAPAAAVTLTEVLGPEPGRQFTFTERTTCIVGRHEDCYPRIPKDQHQRTVSRCHCLLNINPPEVWVRDLGSLGGTFVHGKLIGRRNRAGDRGPAVSPECRLHDGDEVQLCEEGVAVFRVNISGPVQSGHGPDAAADPGSQPENGPGSTSRDRPGRGASILRGYRRRCKLGVDDLGTVWLADSLQPGPPVIVRSLRPETVPDASALHRFLIDLALTHRLKHRNLVRLHAFDYTGTSFVLVYEYCPGGSVAQLLRRRGGTLPLDEALEITWQALHGLHHAHTHLGPSRALVHGNLTLANLYLCGEGSARMVKVGDYGLARALAATGLRGSSAAAGPPGPDADVRALAAALYQMLTGAVLGGVRGSTLPKPLTELLERVLRATPEEGLQTALQFREALEEVC